MSVISLGGWLFKQRTWLPVPLALALLLIPATLHSRGLFWSGVAIVAIGELIRIFGVAHIGSVSRTRSDRLGPLVVTGPFACVRNPLYLGNLLLWIGFAASAGLPWLIPVFVLLLGGQYHAIVRWEEGLLESRLGDAYRAYAARVPRWIPTLTPRADRAGADRARAFSVRETLFSERGTLIAIAIGYVLLWAKSVILR